MHLVLPPSPPPPSETMAPSSSLPTHAASAPDLLSTSNASQNVLRPRRTRNMADDSGEEQTSRRSIAPEAGLSSSLNPRHAISSRETRIQGEIGRGEGSETSRQPNPPQETQSVLPTDENSSNANRPVYQTRSQQETRPSSFGYIPLIDPATGTPYPTMRHTPGLSPGASNTASSPFQQSFMPSSARASSGSHRSIGSHADNYTATRAGSSGASGPDSRRHRLGLLTKYIQVMEHQLQAGSIPSVDDISRIRFQLFQFLDEQHRNPLEPRDSSLEALIARISCVATRADQLRMLRAHNIGRPRTTLVPVPNNGPTQVYLASSPSGFQGAVMPPAASTTANTTRRPSGIHAPPPPNIQQFLNHGLRGNVGVNQAMLQPRNRHRIVIRPSTFVRSLRGFWLFIRLYFFCYILSASGTWFRYALVTMAVFAAYLSETDIPQRLNQILFRPIQRHLEDLIPLGPHGTEQARRTPDTGEQPARNDPVEQTRNPQSRPTARGAAPTPSLRDNFRGVERSVALFVASLVPGVSERHIAARNAAAALQENLERERANQQEEEQRRQDAAEHDQTDTDETASQETPDPQATQPTQGSNRAELHQVE